MDNDKKTEEPVVPMVEQEKYIRLAADFDNYRKSMERQLEETAKFGGQAVVLQVIDAFDLLEQAVSHAPPEVKGHEKWWQGLQNVDRKFHDTLKKFGVEKIAAKGKAFDPRTMEAVQMVAVDDPSHENLVHGEMQAGYTMHSKVIRPARVSVYK